MYHCVMDPRVENLKNVTDCESFAVNARERGAPDLADQACKRGIQIRAEVY